LVEPDDAEVGAFHEQVRLIAAGAPPADSDNLSGMSLDFQVYLGMCPSIREVTVAGGSDPARQLTARCLAEPAASPHRVGTELRDVWLRKLRYRHREANLLRSTPATVELDVATKISPTGYFITGLIVVSWAGRSSRS
jgi:hypothetical protein